MPISDYSTALVTGASSGIGAATVRALAARGIETIAAARRRERLGALAGETGCKTLVLDLQDTDALYNSLSELSVDILVNNAGLGRGMTSLFGATREDIAVTIDTNVTALLHVLRAVVPGMIARKRGHVVNIGSVAGLHPLFSAIYGGSKGAVHMINQNLRIELLGSGVRATEICPARVATEFQEKAFGTEAAREMNTGFSPLRPEDIADSIVYALDAPRHVDVATIEILPTEQVMGGLDVKKVFDT